MIKKLQRVVVLLLLVGAIGQTRASDLLEAILNGNTKVALDLIENGANVHAATTNSETLLHIACQNGHTEIVKLLLEAGADINATDNGGLTPLHWACEEGHSEVALELIKSGANINATANSGATPLHMACFNCPAALQALIEASANLALPKLIAGCTNDHLLKILMLNAHMVFYSPITSGSKTS